MIGVMMILLLFNVTKLDSRYPYSTILRGFRIVSDSILPILDDIFFLPLYRFTWRFLCALKRMVMRSTICFCNKIASSTAGLEHIYHMLSALVSVLEFLFQLQFTCDQFGRKRSKI